VCCSRRITELALLVEMHQERGVNVEFVDEAAWVENTTLTFHVDDDEENADHGSRRVGALAFALFEESGLF
jgi:hypothetical protein